MKDIPQSLLDIDTNVLKGVLELAKHLPGEKPPPLVVYCGSTARCQQQFRRVALYDTIRPNPRMFLTIGCTMLSDKQLVRSGFEIDKKKLDALHFWKIFMTAVMSQHAGVAGEICFLDLTDNGDIYIGPSTQRELAYTQILISQDYPLTIRYWSQEQDEVRKVLRLDPSLYERRCTAFSNFLNDCVAANGGTMTQMQRNFAEALKDNATSMDALNSGYNAVYCEAERLGCLPSTTHE